MELISVAETAKRLEVSPQRVQQRIADGSLPAVRVGRQWAIDAAQLPAASPKPSRPLSQRMAWAMLDLLVGEEPHASPAERVRLRSYAARLASADDPASLVRAWLARRGARELYRAAPPDLDDIRSDRRVLASGVSAPNSGIVAQNLAEGYVAERDLSSLVADYFLLSADNQPGNVILHVVEHRPADLSWPLLAADLAEHGGARESARVADLLRNETAT